MSKGEGLEKKENIESTERSGLQSTLIFDEIVEFDEIEDFLFAKRPSVLSADVIDVDVPIRSRGAGALASLLLLLSFKLRRRTGFFRPTASRPMPKPGRSASFWRRRWDFNVQVCDWLDFRSSCLGYS